MGIRTVHPNVLTPISRKGTVQQGATHVLCLSVLHARPDQFILILSMLMSKYMEHDIYIN